METQNQCYTYFRIVGRFDPDAVTALLDLQPDQTWRSGDIRRDGSRHTFDCWTFGRCAAYDPVTARQMERTIAPLLDKADVLNRIQTENGVSFYLEVVPAVDPAESTPCLAPSLAVIDFCHTTRTEIDMDLYIL